MAEASLNTDSDELTWKVGYSGLTGPVTAGEFHGPAEAGRSASVVVKFQGSLDSPITGVATIMPAQAKELMSGIWYVNLHTQANPGGEIRAQMPTPAAPTRTQPISGY